MQPISTRPAFMDRVIMRVATQPFQSNLSGDDFFRHICENNSFMLALFHAHPLVHRKSQEWLDGRLADKAKIQKLKQTLYNYYTRMFSNAVPYGFFSSVGVSSWKEGCSKIEIGDFKPVVRLDMEVLGALVHFINGMETIRTSVRFVPNNTIYQTGKQFRYVETTFDNNKIGYKISAVEYSDFLESVFKTAGSKTTISELAKHYAGEDYSEEELSGFFYELVDAQLLVSEIQLNITGRDPLTGLIEKVNSLDLQDVSGQALLRNLHEIFQIILKLNEPGCLYSDLHERLISVLKSLPLPFDERHLLQVDNFISMPEAGINAQLQSSLYEAIRALSCFNQNDYKPFIENFKTKFTEKYEDAWVPLMQAIDTELGLSFGYFTFIDDSPLTAGIDFIKPAPNYLSRSAEGDRMRRILYRKYFEACLENAYTVQLKKEDLQDIPDKVTRMGSTFQVVFNIVNEEKGLLFLRTAGNSSGGNLLSRFAYASEPINQLLKDIGKAEQYVYRNSVLAEIVHIPDHRIGNITFRPVFRNYEIPVLTPSVMPADQQLPLNDLLISIRNGRIVLWSKKLNSAVIPMLTNAHNYGLNTSPAYQFLSELVYQDMIPSLFLDRGEISYLSVFNRRIQYENVILNPATWNFEKIDLQELFDHINDLDDERIAVFRKRWSIPDRTTFSDNGSNMLIQWTSIMSVQYFLKTAQKRTDSIFLEEYLFEEEAAVARDIHGRPYYSEFIAVVNNSAKQVAEGEGLYQATDLVAARQKFFPGEEWIYFKIYTGIKTSNRILRQELKEVIDRLKEDGLIHKFFFIRYNDPEYHIRLRLQADKENTSAVIIAVQEALSHYTSHNFIWKMQIDTYMRELDRYGVHTIGFSESVFEADSNYFLELLALLEEDYASLAPLFFAKGIDSMLDAFGLDLEQKHRLMEKKKRSYEQEFTVSGNQTLRSALDKKEKDFRKQVAGFMRFDPSGNEAEPVLEKFNELLQHREIALKNLVLENRQLLDRDIMENLLNSFIHMHAIRLFQSNPRENELVGYFILYFYYHKIILTQPKIAL